MKHFLIIFVVFLSVLLCTGCQIPQTDGSIADPGTNAGSISSTYNDTFNKDEWEVGVTNSVNYANFTVGTWMFRKETVKPDGTKKVVFGEFLILNDIIGLNEVVDNLQYTKISEFINNGTNYYVYSAEEIQRNNSSTNKLYLLNRYSGGTLNTSVEAWSKSTVIYANNENTKFKSYAQEWARNNVTDPFAIHTTTYFFEKKTE